jgi:hypothetical protein
MATDHDTFVGSKSVYGWFFGAGAFAVILTLSLLTIDDALEASRSEQELSETLYELRTAQARVGAGRVDSRLLLQDDIQKDMPPVVDSEGHEAKATHTSAGSSHH